MALLDDLAPGVLLKGIRPQATVTIVAVTRHGADSAEIIYKDAAGTLGSQLVYRADTEQFEIAPATLPWSFTADGAAFRLASEAHRMRLAYLFDPLIAVHTSLIDPLPHQITAVYETMLNKQPLRYLLADDPGAGKTIMTGLLIKELMVRGDLRRCLIVAPGNLVEQWQDELLRRFHLRFEILTNDRLEASASGNAFQEMPLCLARLDKLARNEEVQARLAQSEWDLVVVDEAHKLSATFYSSEEIKYTKRYRLGELLGRVARHLLLLSATPHNGKEADFQLFLRLLDPDRFEGRFRDGVHKVDVSDLMRHLVKEQLYTFDDKLLFPERKAYTKNYRLSSAENTLYQRVTAYVRDEFNRAEALENNGRKGTVGFALTILQRRLASSPEAIYQSLKRRRERLERRLQELRNAPVPPSEGTRLDIFANLPLLDEDALEDLDEATESELVATEERVLDQATSARTMAELAAEIGLLVELEALALQVRNSGRDRKWEELAALLQEREEMFTPTGQRHKLVIFTEHRDTLNYLAGRIRTMLGQPEAVVTIHGGMNREERARAQHTFTNDPVAHVLVATDAAGEGINLQRAHLMVNYDLPWNPNRLEQRFGRIHRIGQREVCHLWNLVANETREGEVFQTLFHKLEHEREALGGRVFDVLGDSFDHRPLRDLMIEAIRYGEQPEVKARLFQVVEEALDHQHLEALLAERALTHEVLDVARVQQVRAFMERAQARRLQPHFIAAFFLAAFKKLGGQYYQREGQRYELTHVPPALRQRALRLNPRAPLATRYARITFEKETGTQPDGPQAELVCPGNPLLDAVLDLVLEQEGALLTQGAVLVDASDPGLEPRLLFYLEHTIQDARILPNGQRQEVSRQLHFVEINAQGEAAAAGYAPFLDYRPLSAEETALLPELTRAYGLETNPEQQARTYAIEQLVPRHMAEVKARRDEQIRKTMGAVNERLSKEITYWDGRAATLRAQEANGKTNARINSQKAQERSDELATRLTHRMDELNQERQLSPLPPVVIGGALIVTQGLLDSLRGASQDGAAHDPALFARETALVEKLAMQAVMRAERALGHEPRDVSALKCGYDIESRDGNTGALRFIEVKGRRVDSTTVTVTKNEILTAFNQPTSFLLALVMVDPIQERAVALRYVRRPFTREPDFGATSVNYDLSQLWHKGEPPIHELS